MYQFKIQIIPILNFLVCKILRERGLIFVTVSDRMREGVSILPKIAWHTLYSTVFDLQVYACYHTQVIAIILFALLLTKSSKIVGFNIKSCAV